MKPSPPSAGKRANKFSLGKSDDSSLLPSETHHAPTQRESAARAEWLHAHGAPAHYVLMTAWEMAVLKEHADMLREKARLALQRLGLGEGA